MLGRIRKGIFGLYIRRICFLSLTASILLHLYGCANIQQPTGGLKDITNPILVASIPHSGEKNYNNQKIVLNFNEEITENAIQKELIIAPYMDNTFRTTVSKKKLTLEFDKQLPDNTTINLNFRNGVKDVHEGNLCRNLNLVFSTGKDIDTLQLQGNINDLLTKQVSIDVTTALYPLTDTLNIYKHKPLYITRSDSNGHYHFKNIKQGHYQLLAFTDNNNNLIYNNKEERLGYITETITLPLGKKDSVIDLELAINDVEAPKRLDDAVKGFTYRLTYNENLAGATFSTSKNISLIKRIVKKNLTLTSLEPQPDSIHLLVTAQDSSGNSNQDTLTFKLDNKPDSTNRKKGKIYKQDSPNQIIPGHPITFSFLDSVKNFITSGLSYSADSGKTMPFSQHTWNNTHDILKLEAHNFNKTLKVFIQAKCFTLLNDSVNKKTDTLSYTLADEANYGLINCAVNPCPGKYILQLLNERYEVVDQVHNKPLHAFKFVSPGNYYIRVIEDANGNGIWDPGHFKRRQMPEKCRVYKDKIAVKANWEIEEIRL
jgi:uncharacterized protein (DUF2141 family)